VIGFLRASEDAGTLAQLMATMPDQELKHAVRSHWAAQPCGTRDIDVENRKRFFAEIERERYEWEPYIKRFARFERGRGKKVLEIGVGAGTDFINWVRAGATATGVDLTEQGVTLTRERLALEGLTANVEVADAEKLPFDDASFDIVYSYGVLHHTPDTPAAFREVWRVLKPGGTALLMVYHLRSWVTLLVWAVQSAAKGRPWESPRKSVFNHLESPGTKAYTLTEARRMMRDAGFSRVEARSQLSHGDLLLMRPTSKYASTAHKVLWRLYPRALVRLTGDRFGTALMIEATKD
jgi:ubiquinone/menaquinone biosynthesis C-methylase UbiE